MQERKLILYIAMSIDGFIAGPNDDLSFLSIVSEEGEDYGYSEFIKTVDAVILGRKTYDWVMKQVSEFPHLNKETYVITRSNKENRDKIKFYSGDLKELILDLKQKQGKNIFCDGGAEIVNALMKDDLIDEYIISIIPILLGGGTRLFNERSFSIKLKLSSSKYYGSGLVQNHYIRI